jgi:hypothetical protein
VSLSKPSHANHDDAKEPVMDTVAPTSMPNVALKRLQLAPTTVAALRPVLKQKCQSAPTTPGYPKYVRFDQQLEHVRLFLKAQTPSAVNQDPIMDQEDDLLNTISLQYPNWPTKIQRPGEMISIESIILAPDQKSMVGKCKVNNIAFNKQVTVRYTFNYWQDVCEAQAAYRESIGPETANMDRFMFNLPLHDRMERSSHETMYFCLKYTVNGTEYWDNNEGLNYQVEIHRGPLHKQTRSPDADDFVVPTKSKFGTKQSQTSLLSSSPTYDFPAKPSQKKQLGSRYDFSASLSAVSTPKRSSTTNNTRTFRPSPPNRIQSFPSYFPDGAALDEPNHVITQQPTPISYNTGFTTLRQEGFVTVNSKAVESVSDPVPISARPDANSSSYFDLVNKYCFYGSDSPLSRSPNSTPAIHC